MRTKFSNLLNHALLIGAVMCCFSCVQKRIDKTDVDIKNQTVSLRKYIRDRDMNWVYLEYERNVKFKDVDSIVKLREKELDSIWVVYRSLK